jgi:hypothetical protein
LRAHRVARTQLTALLRVGAVDVHIAAQAVDALLQAPLSEGIA